MSQINPLQPAQTMQKRAPPQSELDLTMLTTDSVWGRPDIAPELKTRLNKYFVAKDEKGKETTTIESLWGLLGFYTRDMRLANLSTWNGELEYCRFYLDLANDLLQDGHIEPFLISLSRVATMLELSQSKGGFLRRRMGTFTHEQNRLEDEPPKKNLFGAGKNKK